MDTSDYVWGLLIVLAIIGMLYLFVPNFFNHDMLMVMGIITIVAVSFMSDDDYAFDIDRGGIYSIRGGAEATHDILDHSHGNDIDAELNSFDSPPVSGSGSSTNYMKMSLMDPKHNLREVAKQLILLEDHMAHKPKRCIDCITKHYLMVEGLLEEAITLDKTGEHHTEIREITEDIKPAIMQIIDAIKHNKINDKMYQDACQSTRNVRKKIALKYVLNT
jgi:hypothetical protein